MLCVSVQANGDLAQFVYRENEDSREPSEMPFYISARQCHDEAAVTVVLPTADGKVSRLSLSVSLSLCLSGSVRVCV